MQRLFRDVVVTEIEPPPIPEAPPTAMVEVDARQISDLLWADRFGTLSVTILPQ
jgi:hypothetical protein